MQQKNCSKCGLSRPLSMFHKKSTGVLGRNASCKPCVSKNKRSHALRKKKAKERRTLTRSRYLDVSKMTITVKEHPVSEKVFEDAVTLVTEAINNHYLSNMDDKLWESEKNTTQEYLMAE